MLSYVILIILLFYYILGRKEYIKYPAVYMTCSIQLMNIGYYLLLDFGTFLQIWGFPTNKEGEREECNPGIENRQEL